jgi:hypothetical protein
LPAEPAFRPKAPSELTSEQAAEWKSIVNHMPANWFGRESHSLLIAYLRHWSNARLIAAEIERFAPAWLGRDDGLDRYEQLLKIADREHRAMASLAGKMRLSQSSRLRPGPAATAIANSPTTDLPWEFGETAEDAAEDANAG